MHFLEKVSKMFIKFLIDLKYLTKIKHFYSYAHLRAMFENYYGNTGHRIEEKLKEKLDGGYLNSVQCFSNILYLL
jgi:hypothetical protein